MTPDLVERSTEQLARLRAAGNRTGPDDYALANLRGGRMTRQRVDKILKEAAVRTNERLEA